MDFIILKEVTMPRYLLLLLALITTTGCSETWLGRERAITQINSTEASRVIITFSEKLHHEKHMDLDDSVLFYNDKINRIRLDYTSLDILDLSEARALLVDVVEEFLGRINANQTLGPDLIKNPMTASNLEIYIKFSSFYDKYIDLQTVGLITLRDGIVTFFASDSLDCETDCWHKRSEYYYQSKNFAEFKRQGETLYKPRKEDVINSVFSKERYYPQNNNSL